MAFLDDEDHRLSKKNEEVLKNIERARRRRAEEEQKYRVNDGINDGYVDPRTSNMYNEVNVRQNSSAAMPAGHRNSPGSVSGHENGVLTKSPSSNQAFGKFDVGGQTESDDYDSSEKFESYDQQPPLQQSSSSRNVKQLQQSSSSGGSSVPPRFKRHGVELHSYKRTSPPKERGQHYSGEADVSAGDNRSSTSRESAENQSQEKDYGALFRQPLDNPSAAAALAAANTAAASSATGWGMRRQSGGSSDQAEDLSVSSASMHEHQHAAIRNGSLIGSEDEKKFAKEPHVTAAATAPANIGTEEEFSRHSGGRHSLKGKNSSGRGGHEKPDETGRQQQYKGSKAASSDAAASMSKDRQQHGSKQSSSNKNENRRDRGDRDRGQRGQNNSSVKRSAGGDHKLSDRSNNVRGGPGSGVGVSGNRGSAHPKKMEDNDAGRHQAFAEENVAVAAPDGLHVKAEQPEHAGDRETQVGWFAPRGQPSRRGRGGVAGGVGGRGSHHGRQPVGDKHYEIDDNVKRNGNRKSQPRDVEWDGSSSDRSEEARGKELKRRSGDNKSQGRQRGDKTKKANGQVSGNNPGNNEVDEKRNMAQDDDIVDQQTAGRNNRQRGGNNSNARGGGFRNEEKEIRRGGGGVGVGAGAGAGGRGVGGHPAPGNTDRERRDHDRDRDTKQTSYERRQSKLPPRLAKQKEQNRYSAAGPSSISSQEAWGPSSNERPVDSSQGTVPWDLIPPQQQQFGAVVQQQQQQQPPPSMSAGGMVDFDTNRALLMQRFRQEEGGLASDGNPSLRLEANLAAVGVQPGVLTSNMEEAFTAESRENAVQTIIFENTNFKGNRPLSGVTPNAGGSSEGEKLMFKLAAAAAASSNDKAGLGGGFGGKPEDDLKLDFTFATADISTDDTGEAVTAKAGSAHHRSGVPSSSVASVVPTSAQPATADDLNMKIASVKKVWETLPSMSPVPGTTTVSTNDPSVNPAGIFAPPAVGGEDKVYDPSNPSRYSDKDSSSNANIGKVRPQQQQPQQQAAPPTQQIQSQPPPQPSQHQPPHSQTGPQAPHHLPPPLSTPSQQQVQHNNQSIQSQLQQQQTSAGQLHHATHQGLLQQASMDDRLLGRGSNQANLAYNRLLGGAGGLPNLQSPPSILGQQPSLYQAFQIDPNRGVTNQLYPYPPTGMGGQSLMMPPSGSSLSAGNSGSTTGDIFGSNSTSQFGRQFAAPPPGSTQASSVISSVLMSQPSLMSSAMKQHQPSVASAAIGPIGTKGAFQQGGLGSLPGSGTSPLLIPYDGGYVQNIQRSAAAAAGQTAFYQALAASSQQAAAAAASTSRHQQSNYGMTGFPGSHGQQQSLVQQQLMRNQVPPQMQANPYVKPEMKSAASTSQQQQLGGLQNRQYTTAAVATNSNSVQQQQQQAVKSTVTSLASMSLGRNTVLGTGAPPTNGTAVAVAATSGTPAVQQTTSYSPTPIQRPPGGKGMGSLAKV